MDFSRDGQKDFFPGGPRVVKFSFTKRCCCHEIDNDNRETNSFSFQIFINFQNECFAWTVCDLK